LEFRLRFATSQTLENVHRDVARKSASKAHQRQSHRQCRVPVLGADRECCLCVPPSPIDAPMTTSLAPAMNRLRTKQRNFTGSGIAPFKMKHPKRQLDEQYQLAGAGGIEP
jgi:hypothetical protein